MTTGFAPLAPTTGRTARPTDPNDFIDDTDPLDIKDLDVNMITLELDERRGPDLDPLAPDEPPPPRRAVARCADGNGTLTGLFFSDHLPDIARAKAMCGLCPLQEECLAGALERAEPWGVWGGELISGGRIVTEKRPCGRPPKNPRPEIVYDELGPVGVVA